MARCRIKSKIFSPLFILFRENSFTLNCWKNKLNFLLFYCRRGVQTSLTSVTSPEDTCGSKSSTSEENRRSNGPHSGCHHHHNCIKYGICSQKWCSSCGSIGVPGATGTESCCSTTSAQDSNLLSLTPDFQFDEEDRCLTPQLENFTVEFIQFHFMHIK